MKKRGLNMKKRKLLIVLILLVLIVLSLAVYLGVRNEKGRSTALALEQLMDGNEYQYVDAKWGMSPKEVKKAVPYAIKKDENNVSSYNGRYFYKSKYPVVLDGYTANASFEFIDDQLTCIKFNFRLGDNYDKWFNTQVDALRELYGEESDTMENSSDEYNLTSKGYKWDTEQTTLQIILMTGDSINPTVMIGVGSR